MALLHTTHLAARPCVPTALINPARFGAGARAPVIVRTRSAIGQSNRKDLVVNAAAVETAPDEVQDTLAKFFPGAQPAAELLPRVVKALEEHGFTSENTIAITNTCRDEVTRPLAQLIDSNYGASFDNVGLGCVLTCGVTGLKAALSHCPVDAAGGRERYVFFSFPHIGVDFDGSVGKVQRPGREGNSAACGALVAALGEMKGGLDPLLLKAGEHNPDDPEYSILKQRLANKCQGEGVDQQTINSWQLPDLTKAAERTVTQDLEYLISKGVDTSKADYAVITGVQIHTCNEDCQVSADLCELVDYIWPSSSYVVNNGQRKNILTNNGA